MVQRLRVVVVAITLLFSLCLTAQCKIIYVKPSGVDTKNGLSWDTARKTVGAGLSVAVTGDEVWVAQGIYVERIEVSEGIALYGGFTGSENERDQRNPTTNPTILDGSKGGNVISVESGSTSSTIIDGFTIRNGNSTDNGDVNLDLPPVPGGGIFCEGSSPTISHNIITSNNTCDGGGIICVAASSPKISSNTITGNSATYGGGIYVEQSSPLISNNLIYSNHGGIYCTASSSPEIIENTIENNSGDYGSGIYCEDHSSPVIKKNNINHNTSYYQGGGICCGYSSPDISFNVIADNVSSSVRWGGGGGLYCENSLALISSNTISGNSAGDGAGLLFTECSATISNNLITDNISFGDGMWGDRGGGIFLSSSASCFTSITNNTIASNKAYWGGAVEYYGSVAISNNILAFNSSGIYAESKSGLLNNNCVYNPGGYNYSLISAGNHDISLDPIFVDRSNGDYHLTAASPCINSGDSLAPGISATDIDGDKRILGKAIDMGADEYLYVTGQSAKSAPEGTGIHLDDNVVTAAFPDYFYIENTDRSNGIRVEKLGHGLSEGQTALVVGLVKTSDGGERYIEATNADENGSGLILPLMMNNSTIGGGIFGLQTGVFGWQFIFQPDGTSNVEWRESAGLSNIGLLIKTSGKVTFVGDGFFYVDDGSVINDGSGNAGVKVYGEVPVQDGEDPVGKFVTVTGISSCEKPETDPVRVIRTRGTEDVVYAE